MKRFADPSIVSLRILQAQMALMDNAAKAVLAIVPSNEMYIDDVAEAGTSTLHARGLPMFRVRVNKHAVPDITVDGAWLNWPPPAASVESALTTVVEF